MTQLELDDIQGLVASGYGRLPWSSFVLLRVESAPAARCWLERALGEVRFCAAGLPDRGDTCLNLAFTHAGLTALGLCFQALKGFSREFQEGMHANERRRRILGDVGENAPERWGWGGPSTPEVHVLLLLYAGDEAALESLVQRTLASIRAADSGLREVERLPGRPLPDSKEHFGFRDGISQPRIAELDPTLEGIDQVRAGEFVLGYTNEHGQLTMCAQVDPILDPAGVLPAVAHTEQRDFGRNGTYLVLRTLAQDVHGFWEFIDAATQEEGKSDARARVVLASKMVGRWPSGAPLVKAPEIDDPELATANDFLYHREDPDGLRCPVGSHIRRTHPRDSLPPRPGSEQSVAVNKRHRLLRRGRAYGPPVTPSMNHEDVLTTRRDGEERGLHFVSLCANLSRQFEFVQGAWVNNPHFAGLRSDTDPLIGTRPEGNTFTIPADPVRERVHDLPSFVTVRGGAYFFLPGRRALRFLASEPRELASELSAPASEAIDVPVTAALRLAQRTSDALERAVAFTRRFTRTRRIFDRLLQQPLLDAAQWWIQRRLVDEGLGIAEERVLPSEDEIARRITEQMTAFLFKHYRGGGAERAGNTKTYGLVRAYFEVDPRLANELEAGVFRRGASYPAWVRFGGPGPLAPPDMRDNGILSIGIKLMDVPGPKLLDDEVGTQDFTGISGPTFTTPSVFENVKLQRNIGRGTPVLYFFNPFDSHVLDALMQGLFAKAHGNPLEARYWSCVPYLYGDPKGARGARAIKYRVMPERGERTSVPRRPGDDYLREAMVHTLAHEEVHFSFEIQLQTDPVRMPLEDACVVWPERLSPWIRVARLRIPAQSFDSPAQRVYARNLSFNPWHAIAEHRPLGNQNRARKLIYLETSKVRQRINGEARIEPRDHELPRSPA
jgi:Dyp-type peroxidase family